MLDGLVLQYLEVEKALSVASLAAGQLRRGNQVDGKAGDGLRVPRVSRKGGTKEIKTVVKNL